MAHGGVIVSRGARIFAVDVIFYMCSILCLSFNFVIEEVDPPHPVYFCVWVRLSCFLTVMFISYVSMYYG